MITRELPDPQACERIAARWAGIGTRARRHLERHDPRLVEVLDELTAWAFPTLPEPRPELPEAGIWYGEIVADDPEEEGDQ